MALFPLLIIDGINKQNKVMIYNSQYATDPILIVHGDDIDITLNVQKYNTTTALWEDYDLTGKSLQLVIVNNHGTIICDWSTTGGELAVATSYLNISAAAIENISCCGRFKGHLVELSPQLTLWKGMVQITEGLI